LWLPITDGWTRFPYSNIMTLPKFKFLEHPADLKMQFFGESLPELFVNAALGMMTFLYGEQQQKDKPEITENVSVDADGVDMLLVNWLAEILYLCDSNNCVYWIYDITEFTPKAISAKISGAKVARGEDEIKAVTYHELEVKQTEDGHWEAVVVFDI
jgi:SHS2 domain-containing protein